MNEADLSILQAEQLARNAISETELITRDIVPEERHNESEIAVELSAFSEWCQLNGVDEPNFNILGGASPQEKLKLYEAVFHKGAESLLTKLRDPQNPELTLAEELNIPRLKSELETLKTSINTLDDMATLGNREIEIAKIFQKSISRFPWDREICHTPEIAKEQKMNCVGASMLGGEMLRQAGIKYLGAKIGIHVFNVVVTSDGRVFWQDMQDGLEKPTPENEELTQEKISGEKSNGGPITTHDIVDFADNPANKSLNLRVNKEFWKGQILTLQAPSRGIFQNELINSGFGLGNKGLNRQAIEVLQMAILVNPNDENIYEGLARAFFNLGDDKAAVINYQKAIDLSNDENTIAYYKSKIAQIQQ